MRLRPAPIVRLERALTHLGLQILIVTTCTPEHVRFSDSPQATIQKTAVCQAYPAAAI